MRVILVDDEPPGRLALRQQLAALPDAEIVAECGDGPSAIEAIVKHAPDVLFLDVQLGGVSGLDVLERVGTDAVPAIVFVTAYDRYAVRAFEAHAVDYLLKPIDPDRFREAWERAAERVALETDQPDKRIAALVGTDARQPLERFVVREGGRLSLRSGRVGGLDRGGRQLRPTARGGQAAPAPTDADRAVRTAPGPIRPGRRTALVNARSISALEPYGKGSYVVHLERHPTCVQPLCRTGPPGVVEDLAEER